MTAFASQIRSHYDRLLERGLDVYGPRETPFWLASIDIRNGGQFKPAPEKSRRTYRTIHAPNGSTLYWDQPAVAYAYWLARHAGRPYGEKYREAADAYLGRFLESSVDEKTGMFIWGNHLFYDVFADAPVDIYEPVHEMRPITPAWELFWRLDPAKTERALRAACAAHVVGEDGEFNRHAPTGDFEWEKRPESMPFLSAGATIVESLGWLAARDGVRDRQALIDRALLVAHYSFDRRNKKTGLLPTQPGVDRWDAHTATTETGLWAAALLRTADRTGEPAFARMAEQAVEAYLRYGFSEGDGLYWGMLRIEDGAPTWERTTEWQPKKFADAWEPLFPSHDYPMHLAEVCLTLAERTGRGVFVEGARRWVEHLRRTMPPRYPAASNTDTTFVEGTFAEMYGRAIHFLARSGEDEFPLRLALDAREKLWVEDAGMFRSHPGVDRADAVDGLGFLFAAVTYLETGHEPDLMGVAF